MTTNRRIRRFVAWLPCRGATRTALVTALALFLLAPIAAQVNERPVLPPSNYRAPDQLWSLRRDLAMLRLPGVSEDYVLGPGDLLEVQVVESGFLNQTVRVSNSSQISLPYLGLVDADLTPGGLEERISSLLRERKLLKEPEVLVYVQEYRSKPIYVLGEVDRPGEYMMTQQLYLMDAILLAGGLDYSAADRAFLHRRLPGAAPLSEAEITEDPSVVTAQDMEVIEVDLVPLKNGELLNPNPLLRKGDVFFVPEKKVSFFYVIGDVFRSGFFELPDKGGLWASRGIAMAGGPTPTAKMSEGVLVRYTETGAREEHKVDFAALLEGRRPDIAVQPNDIIFIPGSNVKTLGYGLLNFVPSMARRTAFMIP
jgi:polysaccharide biosynthesis/export protein